MSVEELEEFAEKVLGTAAPSSLPISNEPDPEGLDEWAEEVLSPKKKKKIRSLNPDDPNERDAAARVALMTGAIELPKPSKAEENIKKAGKYRKDKSLDAVDVSKVPPLEWKAGTEVPRRNPRDPIRIRGEQLAEKLMQTPTSVRERRRAQLAKDESRDVLIELDHAVEDLKAQGYEQPDAVMEFLGSTAEMVGQVGDAAQMAMMAAVGVKGGSLDPQGLSEESRDRVQRSAAATIVEQEWYKELPKNIARIAPAMFTGGGAQAMAGKEAVVAFWTMLTLPDAYKELKADGVSESSAIEMAVFSSAAQAAIETIASPLGGPTKEAIKKGVWQWIKGVGWNWFKEGLVEEGGQRATQELARWGAATFDGVTPPEFWGQVSNVIETVKQAAGPVAVLGGGQAGLQLTAKALADRQPLTARRLAELEDPSRKDFKRAGLSGAAFKSGEARQEFVAELRDVITAHDANTVLRMREQGYAADQTAAQNKAKNEQATAVANQQEAAAGQEIVQQITERNQGDAGRLTTDIPPGQTASSPNAPPAAGQYPWDANVPQAGYHEKLPELLRQVQALQTDPTKLPTKQQVVDTLGGTREEAGDLIRRAFDREGKPVPLDVQKPATPAPVAAKAAEGVVVPDGRTSVEEKGQGQGQQGLLNTPTDPPVVGARPVEENPPAGPATVPVPTKPPVGRLQEIVAKKMGDHADVAEVPEDQLTDRQRTARDRAKKLGMKTVFVRGSRPLKFNGLYDSQAKGTVYVNADADPYHAYISHEWTHLLARENPALYRRWNDWLRTEGQTILGEAGEKYTRYLERQMGPDAAKAYLAGGVLDEESAAQVAEDMSRRSLFWQAAVKRPGMFGKLASAYYKAAAKLRGVETPQGFVEDLIRQAKKAEGKRRAEVASKKRGAAPEARAAARGKAGPRSEERFAPANNPGDTNDRRYRTLEDMRKLLPNEVRYTKTEHNTPGKPVKTKTGGRFLDLDLAAKGEGANFTADEVAKIWEESIDETGRHLVEASVAAQQATIPTEGKKAKILQFQPPAFNKLDEALRLENKYRFWYETYVEAFSNHFKGFSDKLTEIFNNILAATSQRTKVVDNMLRTISVMSEFLGSRLVETDLIHAGSVTKALETRISSDDEERLKTGSFNETFAYLLGHTLNVPMSTNDTIMSQAFGMLPGSMGDAVLYETVARFMIKLTELQNRGNKGEPYQPWQVQALIWSNRPDAQKDGATYVGALDAAFKNIAKAGVPLDNGKLTPKTLSDPRVTEAVRPAIGLYRGAKILTLEVHSLLTPEDRAARALRNQMEATGEPSLLKHVYDEGDSFEKIHTRAADALTEKSKLPRPFESHKNEHGKWPDARLVTEIAAALEGLSVSYTKPISGPNILDIRRIERGQPGGTDIVGPAGTFESNANMNVLIPLWKLGDKARKTLLAIIGQSLDQSAMAASRMAHLDPGQTPTNVAIPGVFMRGVQGTRRMVEDISRVLAQHGKWDVRSRVAANGTIFWAIPNFENKTTADPRVFMNAIKQVTGSKATPLAADYDFLSTENVDYLDSGGTGRYDSIIDPTIKEIEDEEASEAWFKKLPKTHQKAFAAVARGTKARRALLRGDRAPRWNSLAANDRGRVEDVLWGSRTFRLVWWRKQLDSIGVQRRQDLADWTAKNQARFDRWTAKNANTGAEPEARFSPAVDDQGVLRERSFARDRADNAETGKTFHAAISAAAAAQKHGKAVEVKDLEHYTNPDTQLFLSDDGLRGAAVIGGNLVSVFKHPDSPEPMGPLLAEAAAASTDLDCFDIGGFLPTLYGKYGFSPTARLKFNREYAPPGWDYETAGDPDVVYMASDPDNVLGLRVPAKADGGYAAIRDRVPVFTDYDDVVKAHQDALKKLGDADKGARFSPAPPIDSPQFKKWFGDSAVTNNPESTRDKTPRTPKIVFHGTNAVFNQFEVGRSTKNSGTFGSWETKRRGLFFSEDPTFAASFADQAGKSSGGSVMPAYLSIQNPIYLDDGFSNEDVDKLGALGVNRKYLMGVSPKDMWGVFDDENDAELVVGAMKKAGYDGAYIVEPDDNGKLVPVWVAFDPKQVKSATGNQGTFDPENPDVRLSPAVDEDEEVRLRGPTPEIEERLNKARGMKPTTRIEKIREWTTKTVHQATRAQEHLPKTKQFAFAREWFRLAQELNSSSQDEAIRQISDIVSELDETNVEIYERKLIADNLMTAVSMGQPLRFGFESQDQVAQWLADVNAAVDRDATVQDALAKRRSTVRELVTELVRYNILPPQALDNVDTYYHQHVLGYMEDNSRAATGGPNPQRVKRGYQRKRVSGVDSLPEEFDYNTNYVEAEAKWMTEAIIDLRKERMIRDLQKRYDVLPKLKRLAGKENYKNYVGGAATLARINEIRGELRTLWESPDRGESESRARRKALREELVKLDPTTPLRKEMAEGAEVIRALIEGGAIDLDRFDAKFGNLFTDWESRYDPHTFEFYMDGTAWFKLLPWLAEGNGPYEAGKAARQILSAIQKRNKMIETALGGKFITPHRLLGDDLAMWQPEKGNVFFRAATVPQKIADVLTSKELESINLTADQLGTVIAMGGPRREFAFPIELVNQLSATKTTVDENQFSRLAEQAQKYWKVWTLLNPKRFPGYMVRNVTGDVDAMIGGAPGVAKRAPEAASLLRDYYRSEGTLTPVLKAARDLGVISSSMTAVEIPDLREIGLFRQFYESSNPWESMPARAIKKYFDSVKGLNEFRENTLRMAAFTYFREELENGTLSRYGGARKETVDALAEEMGVDVAAAHLARNLLGDYGNLTVMGNYIRRKLIPFWSWMEVNAKRYPRFGVNAMNYAKIKGDGRAWAQAVYGGLAVAGIGALYALMQVYNNTVHPDEERDLSDDERSSPHVILGSEPDGSIILLRNTGALGEFLEWFGVNTLIQMYPQYMAGQLTAKDIAREVAKNPVNKVVGGVRPDLQFLFGVIPGLSYYPDVFNPRTTDRGELTAGVLGLTDEYKAARGAITKDGSRAREHYLERMVGVSNPKANALYAMYDLRDKFLTKKGKPDAGRGSATSPIKIMREAVQAGDFESFKRARQEYLKAGHSYEGYQRSLQNLDPIGSKLNDELEAEFEKDFLSGDQKRKLRMAREYAADLQVKMWNYWRTASGEDSPELQAKSGTNPTEELTKRAIALSRPKPIAISKAAKEDGKTLKQVQAEWEADQNAAADWLKSRDVSKAELQKLFDSAIKDEVKDAKARGRRRLAFSRQLQKLSK